ncbi:uncharacterized protein LOC120341929 [Styela clava]
MVNITETSPVMAYALEFLQSHPVVGLILFIPIMIFYLILLFDRTKWRNLEMSLGVCYIVSLPYANNLLSIWLNGAEGDSLTKHLLQLMLLAMAVQAFAFFLTDDSSDSVIDCSLIITNILSRGGLLLSAVYAMLYVKSLSPLALKFDYVFLSLLMVGDFVHMRKITTKDGTLIFGDSVRFHVVVDALGTFLLGVILLGFPSILAGPLNLSTPVTDVCQVFMRSFGFQLLAGSLLSLSSLCYKKNKDVASILKSKLVIYVPASAFILWNAWSGSACIICYLCVTGLLAMNAFMGILQAGYKQD